MSGLQSTRVTFGNKDEGNLLTVDFKQMPYIAFWAKENAPFLCIEPWAGIGDITTHNQDLTKKMGIIPLPQKEKTNRSYTVEIL